MYLRELHLKKNKIEYNPIENEREIQESIFYVNGDVKNPVGTRVINKYFEGYERGKINEHDIVESLSKRNINQHNFLLLYHCYRLVSMVRNWTS